MTMILEMNIPSFPFDIARAVNRICGDECGYPGQWDEDGNEIEPCSKETCEFYKRRRAALARLHVSVRTAERVVENPLATTEDSDDDLCGNCAFGSTCTTSFGNFYEPPEYGLFCVACQLVVEEVECGGRFYLTDPEKVGDIEPEELR